MDASFSFMDKSTRVIERIGSRCIRIEVNYD